MQRTKPAELKTDFELRKIRKQEYDQLKSLLQLEHHFLWALIIPPSQKRRLPQLAIFSPLGESNFTDELWLYSSNFLASHLGKTPNMSAVALSSTIVVTSINLARTRSIS
jgi:hypothetical protein